MKKLFVSAGNKDGALPSSQVMTKTKRPWPLHPGAILQEDFLTPLGISLKKLSLDLHLPVKQVAEILDGRRSVTSDTALRLARYFDTSARFWLLLQAAYDLTVAKDNGKYPN
jgi:addiction module HigA family antidote